jgi:peroxiredoxin
VPASVNANEREVRLNSFALSSHSGDTHLQAATAFGIAFKMSQELIELYRSIGNDRPMLNGNGRWALPLPATYVIGPDGRVLYAHIEADYRERAEPSEVIAAIRQANNDSK